MSDLAMGPTGQRRGRGARERILAAARGLFETRGVPTSGMDRIADAAGVSKRTVYRHFPTKDDVLSAYLGTRDLDHEPWDVDESSSPRERILAVFTPSPEADGLTPLCPFVQTAVELPDPDHPAREIVRAYKSAVADRFAQWAAEAGAREPDRVGEQLALLLDGASTRTRVTGVESMATARAIARTVLDAAIPRDATTATRR
ncbi:TetR/AcrR family transcriptional regulator [Williamsia sp. SKLECPSW1]